MFTKNKDELKLDSLIDDCMQALHDEPSETTEEYATILSHLNTLNKMKTDRRPSRVNPDTMLTVAANLFGIFMILKHERVDIITSKAMSFVPKLR